VVVVIAIVVMIVVIPITFRMPATLVFIVHVAPGPPAGSGSHDAQRLGPACGLHAQCGAGNRDHRRAEAARR